MDKEVQANSQERASGVDTSFPWMATKGTCMDDAPVKKQLTGKGS